MKLSFRKSSPRQHFQTLHQTAVTGPDCADWDRNVAFSEWHFTLIGSTALLQVVLHLTQPECVALGIALQIEINCTVLQWVGLDWTGQDRTGQHFTELDCCSCLSWTWGVPDGNTSQCTCVDGTGLGWAGQDCTGPQSTELCCTELLQTMLDFTRLHYTALSRMNWKSTYSIVCIALDWTWKDFSGLLRLQWSQWYYT